MAGASTETANVIEQANMAAATRFIEGFNTDDWDAVREVVAPGFVFHHPLGGTVEAGPEGMIATWAGFKVLSPDSWHPIPVMIAEGDHVAVLLPTYGHFTGVAAKAPPPTGGRLDYGMVNIVRVDDGRLVEMWFGMDPLIEMQQMGVAPPLPSIELSPDESDNLRVFYATSDIQGIEFDHVTASGDVVVAFNPSQREKSSSTRCVEMYRFTDGAMSLVYSHEITTAPSYSGDPSVDTASSRAIVDRWISDVLNDHDTDVLAEMALPSILIHPTAMPCEASFVGLAGATRWLGGQWDAFSDLSIVDHSTVASGDIVAARWSARGTSSGPFLILPPTGETIEYTGVSMYRVENGRIAEIWETRNTIGIMHQLNPAIGGLHAH